MLLVKIWGWDAWKIWVYKTRGSLPSRSGTETLNAPILLFLPVPEAWTRLPLGLTQACCVNNSREACSREDCISCNVEVSFEVSSNRGWNRSEFLFPQQEIQVLCGQHGSQCSQVHCNNSQLEPQGFVSRGSHWARAVRKPCSSNFLSAINSELAWQRHCTAVLSGNHTSFQKYFPPVFLVSEGGNRRKLRDAYKWPFTH